MKRLFVPTDFSECAINAYLLAIEMAKRHNASIELVHGYSSSSEVIASDMASPFHGVPATMSPEQINQFIKEQQSTIARQLLDLKAEAEKVGVTCNTYHVESSQFDVLAKKAEELEADLVIMGSHGAKGVRETLMGSNTQKFVRNCSIPVLTIKNRHENFKVYHAVFASTFSDEGEAAVYQRFRKLFSKQPMHIHFLYVNTPGYFNNTATINEKMETFLKDAWPEQYSIHVYNDYSIEEGIFNFCKEQNADLLALATHGYQGLKRWVYSSMTEQLINHAEIPVLSFRLPKKD